MMTAASEHRDDGASTDPSTFDVDPLGPPPAALTDDPIPTFGDHAAAGAGSGADAVSGGPRIDPPAPPAPGGPLPDLAGDDLPSSDRRNLAAVAHLSAFATFAGIPSFVGPLIVWVLVRERDPYVAEAAREALNFNLSLLIYAVAAIAVSVLTLGLGLLVVVPVVLAAIAAWLVLTVLAAARAAEGRSYHYPLTLRLIN